VISHYIFNKSKSKSIIFLHGLHASSGFWLPFLSQFKNFKLVLIDIDYICFIRQKNSVEVIDLYLRNLNLYKGCVAIVSHSLGTVISGQIVLEKSIYKFEICPVYWCIKNYTPEFIEIITSRFPMRNSIIMNDLSLVDKYVDIVTIDSKINGFRLLPKGDCFFKFKFSCKENVFFNGNHFIINEAINFISNNLN